METMKLLEQARDWKTFSDLCGQEIRNIIEQCETGYPIAGDRARTAEKVGILSRQRKQANQQYQKALALIEEVPDPFVKDLLKIKFIFGKRKTWQQVSSHLGGMYSEDYLRLTARRALKRAAEKKKDTETT